MAKKFIGGAKIGTPFYLEGGAPVDDKFAVEVLANLFDESSIITTDLYPLIEVKIADGAEAGRKYEWNGQDRTSPANWKLLNDGTGDMLKAEYDTSNNGFVDKAGKLNFRFITGIQNGAVSVDLSAFDVLDLQIDGNVTGLTFTNGERGQQKTINILKDADNYSFDIAPDYSDLDTYTAGEIRGVKSEGSVLGRIYYKAKIDIAIAEVFDPLKWDLFIKMQDDAEIVLSYLQQDIDQLFVTPKIVDVTDVNSPIYYAITIVHNA